MEKKTLVESAERYLEEDVQDAQLSIQFDKDDEALICKAFSDAMVKTFFIKEKIKKLYPELLDTDIDDILYINKTEAFGRYSLEEAMQKFIEGINTVLFHYEGKSIN
jgi:hypothetical protein